MLLGCDWKAVGPDLPAQLVRNALSISGVHDLRPLQHAPFIADALRLTDAQALRLSPALWPAPKRGQLYTVAGSVESEEFIRQNALMGDAWGSTVVPVCEVLPGLDHFSVVDALADPDAPPASRWRCNCSTPERRHLAAGSRQQRGPTSAGARPRCRRRG